MIGKTILPSGVTPSGIAYQRPRLTGQLTSYATYDDAWQFANGTYNYTPPVNPIHIARLDRTAASPFHRLVNNNAFGNKFRFTTANGSYWNEQTNTYHLTDGTLSDVGNTYGAGASGIYVLDNLSGLGYLRDTANTYNFNDLCAYPIGLTFAGFNDWRSCNVNEWINLRNWNETTSDDVTKYVLGSSTTTQAGTITTLMGDTTKYIHCSFFTNQHPLLAQLKTTLLRTTMVRNHFN